MDCENKHLCNFSLNTRIDDVDLPNKIKDKLNSLDLHLDPEKIYDFDVFFSTEIYYYVEFYRFPVDWTQEELDKLEELKNKNHINERTATIKHRVLSQQLKNICEVLETVDINFDAGNITGLSVEDDVDRVDFRIKESDLSRNLISPKKKKNYKTVDKKIGGQFVVEDLTAVIKNSFKALNEVEERHEKEEKRKMEEKSQHTPNMKSVEEFFLAVATAILEDRPNKGTSPEKLSREMMLQADIIGDWPLSIRGNVNIDLLKKPTIFDTQIDCPEFLIYVKYKKDWRLDKIRDLETAKDTIINRGYNQKSIKQIVVLHNLKNVKFNLFSVSKGEIEPISKTEAYTAKKLVLQWDK